MSLISIHAPRVGSDWKGPVIRTAKNLFQSTLPVWGATVFSVCPFSNDEDFNPRSPCGERPCIPFVLPLLPSFQSTLPVWGATYIWFNNLRCIHNFNPRSPCGERHYELLDEGADTEISIHAPRVGSDLGDICNQLIAIISIHAPRVGSDDDDDELPF